MKLHGNDRPVPSQFHLHHMANWTAKSRNCGVGCRRRGPKHRQNSLLVRQVEQAAHDAGGRNRPVPSTPATQRQLDARNASIARRLAGAGISFRFHRARCNMSSTSPTLRLAGGQWRSLGMAVERAAWLSAALTAASPPGQPMQQVAGSDDAGSSLDRSPGRTDLGLILAVARSFCWGCAFCWISPP